MHALTSTEDTAKALRDGASPTPVLGSGVALAVSTLLIVCLVLAGQERALPASGWAAAFLLLAAQQDLSRLRIPNWLTFPALLLAILLGAGEDGTRGALTSLAGAGAALALLIGPFVARVLGAGDVKAAMVLGALWGVADFVAALIWMLIAGGLLAIALVAVRGGLPDLLRRWLRSAIATVVRRRLTYFGPPQGATTGLPFAVAMVLGAAAYQLWGAPWL